MAAWLCRVALTSAVVLGSGCGSHHDAQAVRLGGIFNTTGAQASLDGPTRQGALLAAEQINAAGGVLGRRLEVVSADGETDPTVLQQRTAALVAEGAVAVLGLSDTDAVLAAAPQAAAAQTYFVTSGATSPQLPEQVPTYLYLACFGDNAQAAAGAEYAASSLRAATAALLFDSTRDYTVLLGQYFTAAFTDVGGTVVLQAEYVGAAGAAALATQLAALRALEPQPDVLYVAAGPDEVTGIVQQLRAAGLDQPILGGDAYDTDALLALGATADDVYYTTHALLDAASADPRVRTFVTDYQARYGTPPENAFAGLGFDTVRLLADAIARAGSSDRAAIGAALATTRDLAGVTGTISYENGSRVPRKTVTVVRLVDGQRQLAAQFIPTHVPPPGGG